GEGRDAGADLAVGGGGGGALQLPGAQQGWLQQQGLEGGVGVKGRALSHGSSSKGWVPPGDRQRTKTTRNYSRTPLYPLISPPDCGRQTVAQLAADSLVRSW